MTGRRLTTSQRNQPEFLLTWEKREDRRRGCFQATYKGHRFTTGICHGGHWVALHYGPRGACRAASEFWDNERARKAREWCEERAVEVEKQLRPGRARRRRTR